MLVINKMYVLNLVKTNLRWVRGGVVVRDFFCHPKVPGSNLIKNYGFFHSLATSAAFTAAALGDNPYG